MYNMYNNDINLYKLFAAIINEDDTINVVERPQESTNLEQENNILKQNLKACEAQYIEAHKFIKELHLSREDFKNKNSELHAKNFELERKINNMSNVFDKLLESSKIIIEENASLNTNSEYILHDYDELLHKYSKLHDSYYDIVAKNEQLNREMTLYKNLLISNNSLKIK